MQRRRDGKKVLASECSKNDYIADLLKIREQWGFRIYSYALMPNHAHVLIAPGPDGNIRRFNLGVSALSGQSARRFVPQKLGFLTRTVPVQSEEQMLVCARYHDINAVRGKLVDRPEQYEWSSYRSRVGLSVCTWLEPDPGFLKLGRSPDEQRARYKEFVQLGIDSPKQTRVPSW